MAFCALQQHEDFESIPDIKMSIQLRLWQQQPSKAVLEVFKHNNIPLTVSSQSLVLSAIANPISQLLPANTAYIKRLIKLLIQEAEDQKQELSEGLLNLHTALLLINSSSSSSNGSDEQNTPWRYKTFYYSSNPSWQQLQHLQQHHAQHCLSITQQQQQQQQQQEGETAFHCSLPTAQLIQLQRWQQQMSQLVAAAGQPQLQDLVHSSNDSLQHMMQPEGMCCSTPQANSAALAALDEQQQQQQQQPGSQQSHYGLLSVHMSENLFEGGTGCHMWDAGFLMAEFVLNHPELFAGKRCLEIGCGPGLVASCLCRVTAQQLVLTDGDPQTLVNCLSNLAINGHVHAELLGSWQEAVKIEQLTEVVDVKAVNCETQVLACPLDWHEHVPGLCADVILGSDICYDPDAVPSLVKLLQQLLGAEQCAHGSSVANSCRCRSMRQNCTAYIATTKRQDSTLAKFERLAAAHGLLVEEVSVVADTWRKCPVVFQELTALQFRAPGFILHKVTGSQAHF